MQMEDDKGEVPGAGEKSPGWGYLGFCADLETDTAAVVHSFYYSSKHKLWASEPGSNLAAGKKGHR